jgi:ABC-2 type transport system permease protein
MTMGEVERTGQVFDIGYRTYEGPREGRDRARRAIYFDGLKAALGIGRGGRAKILPWIFIAIVITIGLVMALIAGLAERLAEGASEGLPGHSDMYQITGMVLYLFAATVGPELLCPDRQNGVISLYLVRPITAMDYLGGRYLAFFSAMLMVAWVPQVALLLGLVLGDPDPVQYLQDNWLDIPKFLGAGAAIALFVTTLALAVASFTTRRAYASVFLVGIFILSTAVAGMLWGIGGVRFATLISVQAVPMHMNDLLFDVTGGLTTFGGEAEPFPAFVRVGWYILWVVAPALVLARRYRSLAR